MADADGATRIEDVEKLEASLIEIAKTRKHDSSKVSNIGDYYGAVVGSRAHLQQDAVAERRHANSFLCSFCQSFVNESCK